MSHSSSRVTQRETLQTWLAREHVTVPTEGQGRARQFRFSDVVELSALAELTRAGMTVSAAAAALGSVRKRFRQALQDRFGEGQSLVIGADQAWILPSNAVAGFMRDAGVVVYTTLVIANLAAATHRALPRATATLSGAAQVQTEATVVSGKQRARRKQKTI